MREADTVFSQADDGGHTFIRLISFSPRSHLREDEPCAHFTGVSFEVPRAQQPSLDHSAGTDLSGSISAPPSVSSCNDWPPHLLNPRVKRQD